jgi:hypothetical protein
MRYPDDDGLPLWLFILVILLSTATIVVILLIVWLKYVKRSSKLKAWRSCISEQPIRQVSVRKGQLVPASWNNSLSGPDFDLGDSRQPNRHPSHQWPETAYFDEPFRKGQAYGLARSMLDDARPEDAFDELLRRTWSGLLRFQSIAGSGVSVHSSTDEESLRPSCISEWAEFTRRLQETHSKPTLSKLEPLMLESPAPLSPITPLTLPRTPRIAASGPTGLQLPPHYPALPSLPGKVYRASRYREDLGLVRRSLKQRTSIRLDRRLSSPHRTYSQPSGCRSSTASCESFLQAWSGAYRDWLIYPKTASSSEPAKPDLSTLCHVDVISIGGTESEADDEREMNVSSPSTTSILFTDVRSLVSRTRSPATLSTRSDVNERRTGLEEMKRTRREEISWLVDH